MDRKMRKTHLNLASILVLVVILSVMSCTLLAQGTGSEDAKTVTYEEIYDLPYEISPLYIHLQPMYADIYQTNVNFGFGLEAQYYLKDKFDFRIHGRKAYGRSFDIARENAKNSSEQNANGDIPNAFEVYNFFELGATYHIKEREEQSATKVILYSDRYTDQKWAASVPRHISVPSKVRKYYGARLGGMFYNTTTDLSRAAKKQEVVLVDDNDVALTSNDLFGNLSASALYVGASMSWIKNFAVKPDKDFGTLSSDLNLTTFLDLIIAPSVTIDDFILNGATISTEPIELSSVGFRAGLEGKFNRSFGFGYGAEIGVRPGVAKRSFYTLLKLSFPVFSASLKHEQEAFVK